MQKYLNVDSLTKNLMSDGFHHGPLLSKIELAYLKSITERHLSDVLGSKVQLEKLHEIFDAKSREIISITADKRKRTLSTVDANKVLMIDSLKDLLDKVCATPTKKIDPLAGIKEGIEIYFRIVPPGEGGGDRLLHIDSWFDDLYKIERALRPSHKLWIALQTEPPLNGIQVFSRQHSMKAKYRRLDSDYGPRPIYVGGADLTHAQKLSLYAGDFLLFESSSVLHCGLKNDSSMYRVSYEIGLRSTSLQKAFPSEPHPKL